MSNDLTLTGLFTSERRLQDYVNQSVRIFKRMKYMVGRQEIYLSDNSATKEHMQIARMQQTLLLAMDIMKKSCIALVKENYYSDASREPAMKLINLKMKDFAGRIDMGTATTLSYPALVILYDRERSSLRRLLNTLKSNNPSVDRYILKVMDLLTEDHGI